MTRRRRALVLAMAVAAAASASAASAAEPPLKKLKKKSSYSRYEQESLDAALAKIHGVIDPSPEGKVVESLTIVTLKVFEPLLTQKHKGGKSNASYFAAVQKRSSR